CRRAFDPLPEPSQPSSTSKQQNAPGAHRGRSRFGTFTRSRSRPDRWPGRDAMGNRHRDGHLVSRRGVGPVLLVHRRVLHIQRGAGAERVQHLRDLLVVLALDRDPHSEPPFPCVNHSAIEVNACAWAALATRMNSSWFAGPSIGRVAWNASLLARSAWSAASGPDSLMLGTFSPSIWVTRVPGAVPPRVRRGSDGTRRGFRARRPSPGARTS